MNEFNLDDFTLGEELEKIISAQSEQAKEVLEATDDSGLFGVNGFEDPFAINELGCEENTLKLENPFEKDIFEISLNESQTIKNDNIELDNLAFGDISMDNTSSVQHGETEDVFGQNPFETEDIFDTTNNLTDTIDYGFGQDRYINAMHAFVDYMPINLSVDRDIPSHFESLIDFDSELPTIVIEKLPNKMIALIHNLRKRPLPAIPTQNRQPVVAWNGTIQAFMEKLEESVTFTHGFEKEEFQAMKKVIIVENMSDKTDLDQNEIYVTRQDVVDSLLNKYSSIIDLTDENCSINFKDNGKKYSFSIGGLGYKSNIDKEWEEEIRSKIVFMRNNEILLTGIAAYPQIVHTLKETYGFSIVNETGEIKSIAGVI